jgi:hypothetical protein
MDGPSDMKKLVVSFGNFVNKLKNGKSYRKKTPEWIVSDEFEKVAGIAECMIETK